MHEVEYTVALAAPVAEVWDFLARPAQVVTVTDPEAGVRLIAGPEIMSLGTANELEVTGFGLPQKVTYEVTAFAPPAGDRGGSFTETMTRGPMIRFENEHRVVPRDGGGCEAADVFRFDPPGGLLGFVLTADRVRGELDRALAYRHAKLVERFGAG